MPAVCTIVARNYLAHARVLADSFFSHHSDGDFTVLLIDDEGREFDASREKFQCLRLSDIGLDRDAIGELAAIYDVTEFSTAVKPPFLRFLLNAGRTDIIYLDPDIKLFGSLERVSRLAREHSIVLTPHTTVPIPHDGRRIDAFQILASGIYNLGFVALGPRCEPFLEWWWQRTRREARSDPAQMMFTDQRWVDFVPGFFEHFILKDPGYNVAYWNLHGRRLTYEGGRYLVDGQPLTFFHFSGYDGRNPHLLSKHQGERPRVLLSEQPTVARICGEYLASLEQAGLSQLSAVPYGWDTLPSGLRLNRHMRRIYREALEAHEQQGAPEPPNPFDQRDVDRFVAWLNEPVGGGWRPQVSRYLYAIYQNRGDLQMAFPDLAGRDRPRYFDWVRHTGVVEEKIPAQFLPREEGARRHEFTDAASLAAGVNITGYFQAEVGVGEAARLLTSAIEAGGIPHSTLTYGVTPSRKEHPFVERGDGSAPYDINIVCVNADQTPGFAKRVGPHFRSGRHTVGYWFWELQNFPPAMHRAFDFVDEVWTATRFVTGAIAAINRAPVHTIPLPIPIPRCSPDVSRESLRLPPGFMFLFAFDFFSVLERKNPVGLIRAFERAFRAGEGPVLVIKTINGDAKRNDLEKLRAAAAGRPDILIVDEYYSVEEKNALLGLCDCYVSLHRSEGLGLTMAEAMGLEKPVIATAYSGNLDFMTEDNSYLVDYVESAVPAGCAPYPPGTPWAEPNLDQAADYMRQVYEARASAARKARQAREDILTKHNVHESAAALHRRLDAIRSDRARFGGRSRSTASGSAVDAAGLDRTLATFLTSLDHVATRLPPTPDVAPGRRFRRPRLFAQRLLFKVLRPYWWQQQQAQMALMQAIRASTSDAAHAQRDQWQLLESLRAAVRRLGNRSGRERSGDAQETEQQLAEEHNHLEHLEQSFASFQTLASAHLEALTDHLEAERKHREQVELSSAGFQTSAAAHLKALTDQLATVTAQLSTLSARLYAAPFMEDGVRFRDTDAQGRERLGYRAHGAATRNGYLGFEDVFRGTEAFVRERLRTYLPLLQARGRVVEIGCGRGELLDLLSETGVPALGVDIDEAMVQRCRAKGHTVERADANSYLRAQGDCSLPAIFAAQVVEHLTYEDLMSFLQLSLAKLQAGGQLIFETVNPHALEAFKTFWTDLTHQRPIFPEVALVWCSLVGFEQAYVLFPNGSGELEQDLVSRGEYAVVATKGGHSPITDRPSSSGAR